MQDMQELQEERTDEQEQEPDLFDVIDELGNCIGRLGAAVSELRVLELLYFMPIGPEEERDKRALFASDYSYDDISRVVDIAFYKAMEAEDRAKTAFDLLEQIAYKRD